MADVEKKIDGAILSTHSELHEKYTYNILAGIFQLNIFVFASAKRTSKGNEGKQIAELRGPKGRKDIEVGSKIRKAQIFSVFAFGFFGLCPQ